MVKEKFKLLKSLIEIEIRKSEAREENDKQALDLQDEIRIADVNCFNKESSSNIKEQFCSSKTNENGVKSEEKQRLIDTKRSVNKIKKKRDSKLGSRMGKQFKFTPKEDEIISSVLEEQGKNVDITRLAKRLDRPYRSVQYRCEKIKSGDLKRSHKPWTLSEDKVLLDMCIEKFQNSNVTLKAFNLTNEEWKCISTQMGRKIFSVITRWKYVLHSWLLQYFNGTLNQNIDLMLANFIANHYNDFGSIDWNEIVQFREFSGHTESSIKYTYKKVISKACRALNLRSNMLNPKLVAESSKSFSVQKERSNYFCRQQHIIEYFVTNVNMKFNHKTLKFIND